MKGFTIIEILLVIGISVALVFLTLPIGLDFYRSQQLNTNTKEVIQALRQAQLRAMSQEGDSQYGIFLTNSNYTLFKGNSYLSRDPQYDETFALPAVVKASGLTEIVFSKREGKPNVIGNIELSSGERTTTININEAGRINPQAVGGTEIRKPTAHNDAAGRTTSPTNAYDYPDGTTWATTAYTISRNPSITFYSWQAPTQTYISLVLKYRYHADLGTNDTYAVAYSITGCTGTFIDLVPATSSAAPDTTVSANLSPSLDLANLCVKIYTTRVGASDGRSVYTRDIWTEGVY